MAQQIGFGWRTAAAPAAAVVLLPLLVFVDPSKGAAHTRTVRRCISKAAIGGLLCTGVGALAAGPAGAAVAGVTCTALIAAFETASAREKWRMLEEANRRHRALVEAKNRQDQPSGGTTPKKPPDTATTTTTPQRMPGTTPQPTPDTTP